MSISSNRPPRRRIRTLRRLIWPAFLGTVAFGAEPAVPWHDASRYAFDASHAAFVKGKDREARLGEATTLLNLQPRTAANIERAAVLLDSVSAANPSDEPGICARYLRARIEDVHRPQ